MVRPDLLVVLADVLAETSPVVYKILAEHVAPILAFGNHTRAMLSMLFLPTAMPVLQSLGNSGAVIG